MKMYRKNHLWCIALLSCVVISISVLLPGCGKTNSRTLTSATGSVYECLVVMQNNALTQSERNDINRYSLV
ncbi:MAG TPA: hypothetical protein DIW30_06370, partial [Bacteroidales bacterium]|nr:hypothetical protein [Bacteroidales bacterium]